MKQLSFGERVARAVPCPVPQCGAKAGENCRRGGAELDYAHDSRVQVVERGACGPCSTFGDAFEWCIRPVGHAGQHNYDYTQRARALAAARTGGAS